MTQLPNGWMPSRLGDLIELNPKNNCEDSTTVGFVPMPLLGTSYLSPVEFEEKDWRDVKKGYTHFADGDVLLAKITPCFENGKAGIPIGLPNGLGAGSTEYFVCRTKVEVLEPRYLLAWFKTTPFVRNGAVEMTGSVGHKRVPKEYVVENPIPLAPFPEQKRIADKLNTVLARVDACRERLDHVPRLIQQFKQAVLVAAMSGRLTKESSGTPAASKWLTTTLSAICVPDRVITYGVVKLGDDVRDGTPCLRTSNVRWLQLDTSGVKRIAPNLSGQYSRTILKGGEVLVNVRGTLGGVAVATKEMAGWNVSREVAVVPVDESKALSAFVGLWTASRGSQRWLAKAEKGVAYVGINIEDLRHLPVALPPLSEQREIVSRVEKLFAFAERVHARVTEAQIAADQLTPALLAKAFRGELAPQDPNDEPAAELLMRLAKQRSGEGKATKGTRAKRAASAALSEEEPTSAG